MYHEYEHPHASTFTDDRAHLLTSNITHAHVYLDSRVLRLHSPIHVQKHVGLYIDMIWRFYRYLDLLKPMFTAQLDV